MLQMEIFERRGEGVVQEGHVSSLSELGFNIACEPALAVGLSFWHTLQTKLCPKLFGKSCGLEKKVSKSTLASPALLVRHR